MNFKPSSATAPVAGEGGGAAPADALSRDIELTARVLRAAHALQEAIDAAVLAGLIVEPRVQACENRFAELGSSARTFVCTVELYRKLV